MTQSLIVHEHTTLCTDSSDDISLLTVTYASVNCTVQLLLVRLLDDYDVIEGGLL